MNSLVLEITEEVNYLDLEWPGKISHGRWDLSCTLKEEQGMDKCREEKRELQ